MKQIYLSFLLIPFLNFGQQQIGQTIPHISPKDLTGSSISISENGKTVVIGSPYNNFNGISQSGSVRVLRNLNGSWTQIGQDINGALPNDNLGSMVSLSADGKIFATSVNNFNNQGQVLGSVKIYKETSGKWIQLGNNISNGSIFLNHHKYISLSADGNRIAIGEESKKNSNGTTDYTGKVKIYENISGTWTQLGQDILGKTSSSRSGRTVVLHPTRNIVAFVSDPLYTDAEYVSVYFKNGLGNWVQLGKDFNIPFDTIRSKTFGAAPTSISLASNENDIILAIGSPRANNNSTIHSIGIAQVYKYDSTGKIWTQIGSDIKSPIDFGIFGYRVSLSSDGKRVAVSDHNGVVFNGKINDGFVNVYENNSGNWNQIATTITSNGKTNEKVGGDMAFSGDGNTIAIGFDESFIQTYDYHGYVRVYDLTKAASSNKYVLENFSVFPNPATDILNITLENNLILDRVNIYNNLGQVVKTSQNPIIDISTINPGIYYVEISTDKGKATKKIIVN